MNPNFWRGKRVFITGHTGFKGGWLSLWMQSLGAELKGFALDPPLTPNLFTEAKISQCMESEIGDIRSYEAIQNSICSFNPEIIFHMSAQPLVRYSYKNPIETYATNVMGSVHLLESIRHIDSVRVVVNVTTDKCYENKEWIWGYRENEAMGGYDPYSSSKACSELISSAYCRSYFSDIGIGLATARAGNVIGGGDWAEDRLIPDILRSISRGLPAVIRNPNSIRPWQHVLEPLSGYMMLAEALWSNPTLYSGGWNFGPNDSDSKPVAWIAEELCRAWGNQASWHVDTGSHPHEATYLKLDISKAQKLLGWKPAWSLSQALDSITEWHKNWINSVDVRSLCLQQINQYSHREM